MDKETLKLKAWASGFLDGEGCFTIHAKTKRGAKMYYRPELQVQVRADDYNAIEALRKAIGYGHAYFRKEQNASAKRNLSRPTIQCSWRNHEELMAVVSLIDEYPLRGKKSRDYSIWRKAVMLSLSESMNYDQKQPLLEILKAQCSQIKIYVPA